MDRNTEPAGMGINGVMPGMGDCVVETCIEPGTGLMCRRHWRAIPREIRREVTLALSDYFILDEDSFVRLREAQWAAVDVLDPQ